MALLDRTDMDRRPHSLKSCLPEIQRAMAEVWASVLQHLKRTSREGVVTLLAESPEDIEDTTAWVFVFACKVSLQYILCIANFILYPLVHLANAAYCDCVHSHTSAFHLTSDAPDATYTLIQRDLMALIHHVFLLLTFSRMSQMHS